MDGTRAGYCAQRWPSRNIPVLLLLIAPLLFFAATACAQPSPLVGTYGGRLPPVGTTTPIIHLRLYEGQRLEMRGEAFSGEPALIETGTWLTQPDGNVTVMLQRRTDHPYETPIVLTFVPHEDSLTALEDKPDRWGTHKLSLHRQPDITDRVWQLIAFMDQNDRRSESDVPDYELKLMGDGRVTVLGDCQQGLGRFIFAGRSFAVQDMSYARTECPAESLFTSYTETLKAADSITVRDGDLYIYATQLGRAMHFSARKLSPVDFLRYVRRALARQR